MTTSSFSFSNANILDAWYWISSPFFHEFWFILLIADCRYKVVDPGNGNTHTRNDPLPYMPTPSIFTNTQNWQYWHCFQLCIPRNLQFSSLFALHDASKCTIRYQWVQKDYIWRLWNLFSLLISNGTAKAKLAILAFLCCGEFVKTSIRDGSFRAAFTWPQRDHLDQY